MAVNETIALVFLAYLFVPVVAYLLYIVWGWWRRRAARRAKSMAATDSA